MRRATGMRKLQWNRRDIHALLQQKGFTVSYSSVCNHICRISATMGRAPSAEVYVLRKHPAGQKAMQRLSLYYGFTERFCNARSGWEKGSVERSVEIVRHEAFVSRQSFETLTDAQKWLDATLVRLNARSGITGVSDADKQMRILNDLAALHGDSYAQALPASDRDTTLLSIEEQACGTLNALTQMMTGRSSNYSPVI